MFEQMCLGIFAVKRKFRYFLISPKKIMHAQTNRTQHYCNNFPCYLEQTESYLPSYTSASWEPKYII